MAFLWHSGRWSETRPGLYDYRSATLGDALILPVLAGTLVKLLANQSIDKRTLRMSVVIGVLGTLGGALVVNSWLGNPNGNNNWTQPEGRLNFPGWYHAIFLVTMTGFFACTISLLVMQFMLSDRQARRSLLESPELLVILSGFTAFVILLGIDSVTLVDNGMSLQTMLPTSLTVIVITICWISYRRQYQIGFGPDFYKYLGATTMLVGSGELFSRLVNR